MYIGLLCGEACGERKKGLRPDDRKPLSDLVRPAGIEPAAYCLGGRENQFGLSTQKCSGVLILRAYDRFCHLVAVGLNTHYFAFRCWEWCWETNRRKRRSGAVSKRKKVEKYAGIYYRDVDRLDGLGQERMYYMTYRRGGRDAPVIEEPVGRASEGWTPARVNIERGRRIAGGEQGLNNKERRQAAEKERHKEDDPLTLSEVWSQYQKTGKKIIERQDRYLWPHLGPLHNRLVASLTTRDADALLRRLEKTPSKHVPGEMLSAQSQKHILGLLKRLLKYAARQGLCPWPTGLVIAMPRVDNIQTESMTAEQMTAYWQALDAEPDQVEASILRVALLTGIRKSALLALEWSDIDFEKGLICLRGESAKSGKTQYVPLGSATKEILLSLEHADSPLVWPSPRTGDKRYDIRRIACRVRDRAGLPKDFRPMHGLRHAFASHLASSGKVDLYTLQKLLTHGSPQMTQRYVHLADGALRKAAAVADGMVPPQTEER